MGREQDGVVSFRRGGKGGERVSRECLRGAEGNAPYTTSLVVFDPPSLVVVWVMSEVGEERRRLNGKWGFSSVDEGRGGVSEGVLDFRGYSATR
jgi:hypothetical protein